MCENERCPWLHGWMSTHWRQKLPFQKSQKLIHGLLLMEKHRWLLCTELNIQSCKSPSWFRAQHRHGGYTSYWWTVDLIFCDFWIGQFLSSICAHSAMKPWTSFIFTQHFGNSHIIIYKLNLLVNKFTLKFYYEITRGGLIKCEVFIW